MVQDVITYHDSGATVYFVVYNSDGLYWNNGFEAQTASHWLLYAHSMVETVARTYAGTFPNTIGAGNYFMAGYAQLGGTPSINDTLFSLGVMDWDGFEEYSGGAASGSDVDVQYILSTGDVNPPAITLGVVPDNEGYDITFGEGEQDGSSLSTGEGTADSSTFETGQVGGNDNISIVSGETK